MMTLFHDVTDPASAIAVARCSRLAQDGVAITFEGFEAVGLDVALPPDLGVLATLEQVADQAVDEGLTLRRPASMPPTGLAHVLLAHAERTVAAHVVRRDLYAAYWQDGRDVADPAVLLDIAAGAGLDEDEVAGLLADRVALASRRRQMAAFRREGVGGVPVLLASQTLIPALLGESQLRELAAAI